MLLRAAAAFMLLSMFASPFAYAEKTSTFLWDEDLAWLHLLEAEKYSIDVDDQIKDGCWTDSEGSKNSVKLQLMRSGYDVVDMGSDDYDAFEPRIWLRGLGYKQENNSTCVISLMLKVDYPDVSAYSTDEFELKSLYVKQVASYRVVLTHSRYSSNSRIQDAFDDLVKDFLIDLQDRKRAIVSLIRAKEESEERAYWLNLLE